MPGISRLAMPTSAPAGASSIAAVTPRSASVAWHRSQRTGRVIWATMRSIMSRPDAADVPSEFDNSRWTGSATVSASTTLLSAVCAGAMYSVWNAPATASGRSRAPAGGLAVKAAIASTEPAATIWPAPLRLAGVRPAASIAATTSAGSPPRTATMDVGTRSQAAAISAPRRAARATASAGVSTPATAAAVISPTLCPATTVFEPKRQLLGDDHAERDDQRLGDGGVFDLVGVGRGAQPAQVEPGDRGEFIDGRIDPGQFEPRGEHGRGLGALAGSEDSDHDINSALSQPRGASGSRHSIRGQPL